MQILWVGSGSVSSRYRRMLLRHFSLSMRLIISIVFNTLSALRSGLRAMKLYDPIQGVSFHILKAKPIR